MSKLRWPQVHSLVAALLIAGCVTLTSPTTAPPRFTENARIGPGLQWRYAPVVVDVDGDGHRDVIGAARQAKPGLQIWKGDGRGGFAILAPSWRDHGWGAVATADINRDGLPDIVVATHSGVIQTLVSDGRGKFVDMTLQGKEGYAGVALGDLDGDGHLDLAVVGETWVGLEIYRGDGRGNWTLHATLPTDRPKGFGELMTGRAVAMTDLNRDGHVDVVAAFQLPFRRPGLHIYYGDGKGGLTGGPTEFVPRGADLMSMVVADVNNDGYPDILLNGVLVRDHTGPHGPDVLLNDQRGGFTTANTGLKIFASQAGGIAAADIDGDGQTDLVVGGSRTTDVLNTLFGVFWFRPDGSGGWRLVEDSGLPAGGISVPEGIVLADVKGDRRLSIIALMNKFLEVEGGIRVWSFSPR